jgi:hypothetical protein
VLGYVKKFTPFEQNSLQHLFDRTLPSVLSSCARVSDSDTLCIVL